MKLKISLKAEGIRKSAAARFFRLYASPYAKVCFSNGEGAVGSEHFLVGRTETVEKNEDPTWYKVVHVDYDPNVNLWIKVYVYDEKKGFGSIKSDKELGNVLVHVNDLYNTCVTTGDDYKIALGSSSGCLKLRAYESHDISQGINLQFRALHVENIEVGRLGLGVTDPFIEIYKKDYGTGPGTSFSTMDSHGDSGRGGERWSLVYRSEYMKDHLNPLWKGFSVLLEDFCDNNLDKLIKIKLLDFGKRSENSLLGEVETTTRVVLQSVVKRGNGDRSKALEFISPNPYYNDTTSVGELLVLKASIC